MTHAAHQVDGRDVSAPGPGFLGARGAGDLEAFLEVGVPHARDVLVVAVDDPAERHAELVLVGGQLVGRAARIEVTGDKHTGGDTNAT